MAYVQDCSASMVVPLGTTPLGVETVSAAVAVHGEFMVLRRCKIKRIMFIVTVAVAANSTAPVVTFRKRPTPNSSSGQSTIGTLTLPDLTGIGKVLYKDVTPISLAVGDSICLDHTTQAVDGSAAAGAGYYAFELEFDPEVPANESDMIASA
jgi:hypothetical protein